MENVDSNVILLDCLNITCSALILILKSLIVEMIEDFVLFKICPLELTSSLILKVKRHDVPGQPPDDGLPGD